MVMTIMMRARFFIRNHAVERSRRPSSPLLHLAGKAPELSQDSYGGQSAASHDIFSDRAWHSKQAVLLSSIDRERIETHCSPLPQAPPKQTTPRDHHTWADHTCIYCLIKRPTPSSHQGQGLASREVARLLEEGHQTDRAQTLGRPPDSPCRHDAV